MTDDKKPDVWQLQSQFNIQGLVKALSSEDKNIRKRAAAALRAMGAKDAITALRTAYAAEEDANTRMVIATAIQVLSKEVDEKGSAPAIQTDDDAPGVGQSMVQRLIKRLASDDPENIIKAAQHLGDLGDKLAVEPLVLLFNDNNKSIQVRLAVAEALLKLESAPVEVALLANLRHADWHIRRNGAAILGQLKAEWAIIPLSRALHDPHPVVRRTARAALKHIGSPESRKALAQADADSNQQRQPLKPQSSSSLPVKSPGQKQTTRSGMLSKHLEHDENEEETAQSGQSSESTERSSRHTNVTMPLNPAILDQLKKNIDDSEEE